MSLTQPMAPKRTAAPSLPADVVVLGEALVDLFEEEGDRYARHLGGAGANLAVGLARQGIKAALLTLVGGDALGRFVRARLGEEGVVADGVGQHKSARTGVTFVGLPDARGQRSFLFYGHPSADALIAAPDLAPAQVGRGRLLCLGSSTLCMEPARTLTQHALDVARGAGLLVAFDPNFRPPRWPDAREGAPLMRRLLGQCDLVKLAEAEALPLLGVERPEAAAEKARALGAAIAVITLGERGCYLDCPAGQAYLAGERVRAVDLTGAGDAFMAGLCATLLGHLPPRGEGDARQALRSLDLARVKDACAQANHLGARACTAVGATTAVPRAAAS